MLIIGKFIATYDNLTGYMIIMKNGFNGPLLSTHNPHSFYLILVPIKSISIKQQLNTLNVLPYSILSFKHHLIGNSENFYFEFSHHTHTLSFAMNSLALVANEKTCRQVNKLSICIPMTSVLNSNGTLQNSNASYFKFYLQH